MDTAKSRYGQSLILSARNATGSIPMPYETLPWASLIQTCTSLRKARQIHALIIQTSISTTFIHNNLLSIYAKHGSLQDSHKLFDQMPQRNLVSFNALISSYSRLPHQSFHAFQLLHRLTLEGFRPNNTTFSSLFQAASSLEDMTLGLSLHSQVAKFGFLNDLCVQTSLLGMYSSYGSLKCAKEVFSDMVEKDAIAWNSLIFGGIKNEKMRQGIQWFCSMVRDGVMPTQFTFTMVLNACSKLRDYDNGRVIHARVIISNIPPDMPLHNALLDMYSRCGDVAAACHVFRKIEFPDLVSWNSIIAAYLEIGDGETAMYVFNQLCQMGLENPDEYTLATTVSAIGVLPALDYGRPLHAYVEKVGLESSIFVGSTLISMYLKNGDTDSAQRLFSPMRNKDVIVWTEMICGHSRLGDGENAFKCFYQMQQEGHKVDSFAISSVLSSCADLATLKQGEMIHSQAVKAGYEKDTCVCGSLVDMYAKTGNLPAAQLAFSVVSDPDLKCWNSLLGGYSNHGKAEEAINLFDEIVEQGLLPDQVTFVTLLSACSHCGLVERGMFFWNYMKRYGIGPGLKHYSCIVSLLCRSGLLDEAEDMIEEAPFGIGFLELWRILLSSCVIYRKLELGVYAAEQILRIDADDSATLILLSNLYAAFRMWDAVADMRKKIRGMMLEKDPGLSWIDIRNKIHIFASDDQSHPKIEDAQAELQSLQGNMIRSEICELYPEPVKQAVG